MLEWAAPQWLLLLPVLAWVSWRGVGPRVAVSALGHLRARATLRRRLAFLPGLAWGVALVLMITALARPQLVNRERIVESEGLDIMLVLDTSGSMDTKVPGLDCESWTWPQCESSAQPCTRIGVSKDVFSTVLAAVPRADRERRPPKAARRSSLSLPASSRSAPEL